MKAIVAAGAAAASLAAVAAMFAGAAPAAAAPDVVGQTYADAVSAISSQGGSAVVASRVGSRLQQDDCIVANAWDAPFLRGSQHASGEVMLALNCSADAASAGTAGNSAADAGE